MSESARRGVLLVGCGKMGSALLGGWLDSGAVAPDVPLAVVEPMAGAADKFLAKRALIAVRDVAALPSSFLPEAVVLAVKPQGMEDAAGPYSRFVSPHAVFLSIAAGRTIAFFERVLGAAAVVRAMPNTPAAVGRGVTVACPNARVSAAQRQLCDRLLASVGEVAWVGDEALLDPVTAVSGSGPAYVFLLVECLAQAGVAAGLPADLALQLARATVSGSGELLRRSSEPADQLRRNVTSPGGTTAAALDVLMAREGGLAELMEKAVAAATRRSRELAG